MKRKLPLLLLTALLVCNLSSFAQEYNLIKTNLTSLITGNYSLQYERVLTEKVSASLTFSMMPKRGLPFQGMISDAISTNDKIDFDFDSFNFNSWSIVPDVRFYLGEGYGKGFYIAPYFKHSQFKLSEFEVNYTDSENNINNIKLSGDFKTNAGGLMFGAQWLLGEHLCIDWWILGFHGGKAKASILGDPENDLSSSDQNDIRDAFDDVDIPMLKLESKVSADKVSLTGNVPWLSLRAGLSFGVRF